MKLLPITDDGRQGTILRVRVTPRSRREEVLLIEGQEIRVRVRAPAEKGQANAALVKLFARILGVPTRDVEIASGSLSRRKVIEIRHLTAREVAGRLANQARHTPPVDPR